MIVSYLIDIFDHDHAHNYERCIVPSIESCGTSIFRSDPDEIFFG